MKSLFLSQRQSGILLHPTSLPGAYGIGEIGPHARRWIDTLQDMGQKLWQILPLGPTGYGDSPYQSLSTFAGNPAWISFDDLICDGWLDLKDLYSFPVFHPLRISFGPVLEARRHVLRKACCRFLASRNTKAHEGYEQFRSDQAGWLDDFALFMALKAENGGQPWMHWPEPLVRRDRAALTEARRRLRSEVEWICVEQFFFDVQWHRLQQYARRRDVALFGDLPIYVTQDSADVWVNPDFFFLDSHGYPTVVAGVPPDYFSETGQRWGNPLYRWDAHSKDGYAWWIARMRRTFELLKIVRLDHFRGLEKYWEIPASDPTAVHGRWVDGPGRRVLQALQKAFGRLPIVAEDLGVITPQVDALREAFKLPGMTILQFLFGDDRTAQRAASFCRPNSVVYTGTHDNNTAAGWFTNPPETDTTCTAEQTLAERRRVRHVLRTDGQEIHWDLIRFAFRSRARTVLIPLQDLLGLDSRARMNTPGKEQGNWQWRFGWEQLSGPIQNRLLKLTIETRRQATPPKSSKQKSS